MLYFCFYANFLSLTEDNSEFFIKVNFCKFRKIFTRYEQGVFNNCMSEVGARLTEGRRLSAYLQAFLFITVRYNLQYFTILTYSYK